MESVLSQMQSSSSRTRLKAPTFLVGAERSGTTVLRVMLKHHPLLAWCQEFEYTVDLMTDRQNWPNLDSYYEYLEVHRVFRMMEFEIDRSLDYPDLIDSFLTQQRDRMGKPIIGATVHRHFDRVLRIWPDARFIHLTRDARDVARSCIGMGWAGNVWTGVERWIEAEQLWGQMCKSLPEDRRIEVTYEALITDTIPTLTRLCEFMGVAYDPAMLDYEGTSTYEAPDPSLIQQWRRKLSQHEIQLVESRVSQMLEERGYELSGLPLLTVTPMMEKKLRVQDWYGRVQHRLEVFGLPMFFADFLSRRLKLKGWQKQLRFKMNAIEISRLK
jgi:Sulfotransferase family